MIARPAASRITGFWFFVVPAASCQVSFGVVVPGTKK